MVALAEQTAERAEQAAEPRQREQHHEPTAAPGSDRGHDGLSPIDATWESKRRALGSPPFAIGSYEQTDRQLVAEQREREQHHEPTAAPGSDRGLDGLAPTNADWESQRRALGTPPFAAGSYDEIDQQLVRLQNHTVSEQQKLEVAAIRSTLERGYQDLNSIKDQIIGEQNTLSVRIDGLNQKTIENLIDAFVADPKDQTILLEAITRGSEAEKREAQNELADIIDKAMENPFSMIKALEILAEDPSVDQSIRDRILEIKEKLEEIIRLAEDIVAAIEEYRKSLEALYALYLKEIEKSQETVMVSPEQLKALVNSELIKLEIEEELLKALTERQAEKREDLTKIKELEARLDKIEAFIRDMGLENITMEQIFAGEPRAAEALNLRGEVSDLKDKIAALRSQVSW